MRPTARTAAFFAFTLVAVPLMSGCQDKITGGDRTPPRLIVTSPASGATNVARTATINVTYNENIMPSSVTASTVTVTRAGGAAVAGNFVVTGGVIIFTPTTQLDYATQYTVTVTGGVRDVSGNELDTGTTFSFTTLANVIPTLTARTPAVGATNVARNVNVTATFSEPVAATSVTTTSFTLTPAGGTPVAAAVTVAGAVATLNPTADLAFNTVYTARLTTAITDVDGAPLADEITWTFTTLPNVAPTVTARTPAENATAVAVNTNITATFSEPVAAATVTTTSFTVTPAGGSPIAGVVTLNGAVATFNPDADLAFGTVYTVRLATTITDVDGMPVAAEITWTFTTAPPP